MVREIEISELDLRYESYRMKNRALETRLLASITERGIEEPLEGVDTSQGAILLNGFKRYRCARKLKLGYVPYESLGEDEATGIVAVIRESNHKSLSILEQGRFIDELRSRHGMSVAEIAQIFSRSKSWVTTRLNLIGDMSERVRVKLFNGEFPVYSYMYTVRTFMRMNGVQKEDVERFIEAVSGKKLSVREIEQLAHGYFRGAPWFREEILNGRLTLVLDQMKQVPEAPDGCNEFERILLKDLDVVEKYIRRVIGKSQQEGRLTTRTFCTQANLLLGGILGRVPAFTRALRAFHDRTQQG